MTDFKDMLSSLYGVAADSKNFLFDSGLADSVHLPTNVLSVGNLSFGGTGKTPVVQKILSLCQAAEMKAAVIARNYKAESRGTQKVQLDQENAASYFGDEALLLAKNFPEVPVWTGPKKFLTAQAALDAAPVDLLVVDDGFQHRSLYRDFDLVLLDASSLPEDDFLFPKGNLREDFSSLGRASAVAMTKVNWAAAERVEALRKKIPADTEVYEIEFYQEFSLPIEASMPVLAVSGIAQPRVFEKNLSQYQLREHLVFPDHHVYTASDIDRILQAFKMRECQQILTTEKDYVKLQTFPELVPILNPILIITEFREEPRGLHAFLDKCRRP